MLHVPPEGESSFTSILLHLLSHPNRLSTFAQTLVLLKICAFNRQMGLLKNNWSIDLFRSGCFGTYSCRTANGSRLHADTSLLCFVFAEGPPDQDLNLAARNRTGRTASTSVMHLNSSSACCFYSTSCPRDASEFAFNRPWRSQNCLHYGPWEEPRSIPIDCIAIAAY